jgi:hypothetical protein
MRGQAMVQKRPNDGSSHKNLLLPQLNLHGYGE